MEFLDEIKNEKDKANFLLDFLIELGPRKAENNLLKITKKVTDTITEEIVSHNFTDDLTDEQLNEVAGYMKLLLAGFNTYIEQFKGTITKENPHNSGN